MNSLFIFSSIEIVESLQINYLAEVTPRKDGDFFRPPFRVSRAFSQTLLVPIFVA
nr:MAG TPA: hypothetical protein [Caudoviricetes sp.]DAY79615.1 MAG TPA: hypothetical protein [Caudoviricetes sp.]